MTHPLEGLLDDTHRALLCGDLGRLGQLAPMVESLADDPGAMDAATAKRLQRKADRNARLLQAALRGVRTARGRLLDIAGSGNLTTYDARGHKATVAAEPRTSARRV